MPVIFYPIIFSYNLNCIIYWQGFNLQSISTFRDAAKMEPDDVATVNGKKPINDDKKRQ